MYAEIRRSINFDAIVSSVLIGVFRLSISRRNRARFAWGNFGKNKLLIE